MGFSLTHLLILLGIVVVVFGAGKLPSVGKSMGDAIKEFKKGVQAEPDSDEGVSKKDLNNPK